MNKEEKKWSLQINPNKENTLIEYTIWELNDYGDSQPIVVSATWEKLEGEKSNDPVTFTFNVFPGSLEEATDPMEFKKCLFTEIKGLNRMKRFIELFKNDDLTIQSEFYHREVDLLVNFSIPKQVIDKLEL